VNLRVRGQMLPDRLLQLHHSGVAYFTASIHAEDTGRDAAAPIVHSDASDTALAKEVCELIFALR